MATENIDQNIEQSKKTKKKTEKRKNIKVKQEPKKTEETKMEIEINKYKNLVDALGDPVRVTRMVLLIAAVTAILAVGIFGIVYSIKRFYPYKSINSNPYGATIIQDEDNEIIYWLFNTADLWANSGIEVKEGDVISVRTSGAFHTAIHHLVHDADSNTKMKNLWVPSKGGGLINKSPLYSRDTARLKFCIAPDLEYNTVLMQVVPSDVCQPNWLSNTDNVWYVDGIKDKTKDGPKPDIYDIGSGKENIRIRTDGILHFAVNDIALTPRVIDSMKKKPNYIKALDLKKVKGVWFAKTNKSFDALFTTDGLDRIKPLNKHDKRNETIISEELNLSNFQELGLVDKYGKPKKDCWNTASPIYKEIVDNNGCLIDIDSIKSYLIKQKLLTDTYQPDELEYYRYNNFVDAWFVDNIGSFMIVIERKKVK